MVTGFFERMLRGNVRAEAVRKSVRLIDRVEGILADVPSPQLVWEVFRLAEELAFSLQFERYEPQSVTLSLFFLDMARAHLASGTVSIGQLRRLVRLYRLTDYVPERRQFRIRIGRLIRRFNDGVEDVGELTEELREVESEILLAVARVEVRVDEVDALGYLDNDDNVVVRQLLSVNRVIHLTLWGDRVDLEEMREAKRRGGKIYCAYTWVNGQLQVLGVSVVLKNRILSLGVLWPFQGNGIGMSSLLARYTLTEVVAEGYTTVTSMLSPDNRLAARGTPRLINDISSALVAKRAEVLSSYGIEDNTSVRYVTEAAVRFEGLPSETVVTFTIHLYGEGAKRALVSRLVGEYCEAKFILDDLGVGQLAHLSQDFCGVLDRELRQQFVCSMARITEALEARNAIVYYPFLYAGLFDILHYAVHLQSDLLPVVATNIADFVCRGSSRRLGDEVFIFAFRNFLLGVRTGLEARQDIATRGEGVIITIAGSAGTGKTTTGTAIARNE